MPGSSGREMPSGTREGQPKPSAAAAGAGGEVQPSEERARQKMDKRAKLLEQLHQVESAIAKVKSRNPGSRPPSSTNTHRT